MVVCTVGERQLVRRFPDPKENTAYAETTLTEAVNVFGVRSNALSYAAKGPDGELALCSRLNLNGSEVSIPAESFESHGTLRFIQECPLVMRALEIGAVLVVDELDAAIHSMAVMSIINAFHNDEINIHHAQLVFCTHNPVFLHPGLYRRDEIKFVDRDDESYISTLYSLSDFKAPRKESRAKREAYMMNYLTGQYGAIKDVDFAPILERILLSKQATETTSC